MRNIVAPSSFRLIQAARVPLGAVGYVPFVVKVVRYSRRTGASATVLASFYTRYMQHKLGTRRDEPCARLMMVLPNVSQLGLRLETAPTLVAHRLTGYVPPIHRYPYEGEPPMMHQSAARTTFFDQALARHLARVRQLVVLGAGLGTRSYRLPPGTRVRCFEVDTPRTQAFKREMLKKAGVDTAGVTFVAAGFDPDEPSFFLWESVAMYLDREAVESTLRAIAGTAAGSVVAFDYVSNEFIASPSLFMRYARAVIRLTGEPWRFGIDNTPPVRERVAKFLASCGLSLEEQRNFGAETERKGAMAAFATALVP